MVKTGEFSAKDLALKFEIARIARPDMRFALLTPSDLSPTDSMILDKAQVTLIHPGYAFDASASATDTAASAAEP